MIFSTCSKTRTKGGSKSIIAQHEVRDRSSDHSFMLYHRACTSRWLDWRKLAALWWDAALLALQCTRSDQRFERQESRAGMDLPDWRLRREPAVHANCC